MSRTVAIIGATGTLGSCSAFTIGYAGVADEIILIPHTRVNLAKFFQYDLETSLATLNNTEVRVGTTEDAAAADVVLVCAGPPWRQGSPQGAYRRRNSRWHVPCPRRLLP